VNALSHSIRYHGVCFILSFQSISFDSVWFSSVVSTVVTKNRCPRPLSVSVRQRSVAPNKCVTTRNNRHKLLNSEMCHPVWRGGGGCAYQCCNRPAVLSADTNLQSFRHNTCDLEIVSKFDLYCVLQVSSSPHHRDTYVVFATELDICPW
jgi:hypothetical protein